MKIAILQTMYDEHLNVLSNIHEVSSKYSESWFFVTHSFDSESAVLDQIKYLSFYESLINLGNSVSRSKLPANAISRNYSNLFTRFYKSNLDVDLIVALTGDTKLVDAKSFERRYIEMQDNHYDISVCQAKEQIFWSSLGVLDRLQDSNVPDFMPQLFFVDGKFAFKSKIFSNIKVVNEYTSEQCLGEEFLKHSDLSKLGRLNNDPINWLSYMDGVVWQALTNGKPGRP
jgi:hypothetical protein